MTHVKLRALAILLLLALGLLAAPVPVEAQRAGKVPVVGFLALGSPIPEVWNLLEPFRQGLRDQGLIEGENVVVEWRFAEGKPERLPALAADLVRLPVDVLVAPATRHAVAAQKVTRTIPIVMVYVGDPVAAGLIKSYARPGGNVTGTSWSAPGMGAKQLQLLKEVLPTLSRAAALWDGNPASDEALRRTREAAPSLGVELRVLEVRPPGDFDGAFSTMTREGTEAFVVLGTPWMWTQRLRIAELARKNGLPWISNAPAYARAGALMSYAPSLSVLLRRAPYYVARILRGTNPADLPVERPTKFEVVVNLKTAKALGLTIPPSVLIRADKVIE